MQENHLSRQTWTFSIAATSTLVLFAIFYLTGWLRLRGISASPSSVKPVSLNRVSAKRVVGFMGGLALVWVAFASPLAMLDHQSLTVHMMKHLLLMTVAAPLILMGRPAEVLHHALLLRFTRIEIKTTRADAIMRWSRSAFENPTLCWLAGTIAVIGWHLPPAFHLATRSHWAHGIEDACFLLGGLLFWSPIVRVSSDSKTSAQWSSALYLFLATLPCDVLSAFLVFSNRLVYSDLSRTNLFALSPLQDQECAGALMWVWITFAYLVPAVIITMQILSPSSENSVKAVPAVLNTGAGTSS